MSAVYMQVSCLFTKVNCFIQKSAVCLQKLIDCIQKSAVYIQMSAIYIQMSAVVYKVNCLYTKVSCLYTNVSCLFTYIVLFTKKTAENVSQHSEIRQSSRNLDRTWSGGERSGHRTGPGPGQPVRSGGPDRRSSRTLPPTSCIC